MENENFERKNLEKEPSLPNTTLLFLIKKSKGEITDICLAMKKRGFGINRWNGVAVSFYEKLGFEKTKNIQFPLKKQSVEMVEMKKKL